MDQIIKSEISDHYSKKNLQDDGRILGEYAKKIRACIDKIE